MKKQTRGQGVVEYAGALVIAAVLVGAALVTGPEGVSDLFNNIYAAAEDLYSTYLPN